MGLTAAYLAARQMLASLCCEANGKEGTNLVGRGEITDAAWERIAPLMPENGRLGGR